MRETMHWLPVAECIAYKITAPTYIRELRVPISSQPDRRSLCSTASEEMQLPRLCTSLGPIASSHDVDHMWEHFPLHLLAFSLHFLKAAYICKLSENFFILLCCI